MTKHTHIVDLSRNDDILGAAIMDALYRHGNPYYDIINPVELKNQMIKDIYSLGAHNWISDNYNNVVNGFKSMIPIINKLQSFEKKYGDKNDKKTWEKILDKFIIVNYNNSNTNFKGPSYALFTYEGTINNFKSSLTIPEKKSAASTLQAALRRKLTQPPKQAAKTAAKTAKTAAKSTMTEDEKRLERNRKAREKYAAKKAQK